MIEKLGIKEIEKDCGAFGKIIVERKLATDIETQEKINELVDAINNLQTSNAHIQKDLCEMRHPEAKTADPYAEQRKWIGKICEFWDNDDTQQLSYGVLTKIDTESGFGVQYCCNDEYDYDNCQPVKPDEDIIYKGE